MESLAAHKEDQAPASPHYLLHQPHHDGSALYFPERAPALGGVVLSFVVARALGARALFAEKTPSGEMTLRKGLTVNPGDRFLAVEDVVTTG
ncbi:MAG: hypothetical protein ACK4K6_08815, partial [Pseudarthrobacter sp.]